MEELVSYEINVLNTLISWTNFITSKESIMFNVEEYNNFVHSHINNKCKYFSQERDEIMDMIFLQNFILIKNLIDDFLKKAHSLFLKKIVYPTTFCGYKTIYNINNISILNYYIIVLFTNNPQIIMIRLYNPP